MSGIPATVTGGEPLPDSGRTSNHRPELGSSHGTLEDQDGAEPPSRVDPGNIDLQRPRVRTQNSASQSAGESARPSAGRDGGVSWRGPSRSRPRPSSLGGGTQQMLAERGFGSLEEYGRDSGSETEGSEYLTGSDDGPSSEGQSATRLKSVIVTVHNPGRGDGVPGSRDRPTRPAPFRVTSLERNPQTTAAAHRSSSSSSDADSDSGSHEGGHPPPPRQGRPVT